MKFFKSPLCIAALTVFLGVLFASIVFMQIKKGQPVEQQAGKPAEQVSKTVEPVQSPSPADKNVSIVEPKEITENVDVLVSFVGDNQKTVLAKQIPLYTVTKLEENGKAPKLTKVEANGDLGIALIDEIKLSDSTLAVDKAKTLAELEKSIQATNGDPYKDLTVKIITKKLESTKKNEAITKDMSEKGFTTLLAKFKTEHPGHVDDAGRNVNLAIASQKLNGMIIKPKEKFSFNKVVGERSAKNGFKPAGCISAGKVIPGLGGGICQVSTTLYRAVLLSGAKIDERHNHSIYEGIEYAQRGLDAAVAWGYKDFKFTNALDIPLLIKSQSGEGWVEVAIYAEKKPFESIELSTRNEVKLPFKVEKRVNKKLKDGEVKIVHPGVDGYTVEAFRTITPIGGTGKEVRLSKDRYLTYNRIEERNK